METAIIIVLAFMLLIAVIILIDTSFNIKGLNIKYQVCASALDKSNNQNKYLKSNNDNLKKAIEKQEREFKEYKKYSMDSRDSKINELETKYTSALQKIIERDKKIRDKDIKIESLIADEKHINKAYIKLDNEINYLQNIIDEKDAIIKLRDSEIFKYDKCNKQIAEELVKKNNVIEDAWNVIRESEKQKYNAIGQSISAKNLCNEMANNFKAINIELEAIEKEILRKLNP